MMNSGFDLAKDLWTNMRRGHIPLPIVNVLPPEVCFPSGSTGKAILLNEHYFTIRINQVYLAENRQWWTTFDPLILMVVEFSHGYGAIAVPRVIGPDMIQKQRPSDQARHGVVLLDSRVTGPHPYRGGDIRVSLALYQVRRANQATSLLKVLDSLSDAVGTSAEVAIISKVGGALVAGLEGLLGLDETVYIAGHSVTLHSSALDPLESRYAVLISPPSSDLSDLRVENGRLKRSVEGKNAEFNEADFVLWNISGDAERGEENLPFYALKDEAITAISEGEEGIKRGKANLITAYQQMRKSPDVTRTEARKLFERWCNEFVEEKERMERTGSMTIDLETGEIDADAKVNLKRDLGEAARRLGL